MRVPTQRKKHWKKENWTQRKQRGKKEETTLRTASQNDEREKLHPKESGRGTHHRQHWGAAEAPPPKGEGGKQHPQIERINSATQKKEERPSQKGCDYGTSQIQWQCQRPRSRNQRPATNQEPTTPETRCLHLTMSLTFHKRVSHQDDPTQHKNNNKTRKPLHGVKTCNLW